MVGCVEVGNGLAVSKLVLASIDTGEQRAAPRYPVSGCHGRIAETIMIVLVDGVTIRNS
jgi:hypothetical protein